MAKTQKTETESGSTYPSVKALAKDLGMCERSIRRALRDDKIPHIKLGKRYILPRAAIRRWLEEEALAPVAGNIR
jgi:excisionase family DNA binding protein